MAREKGIIMAAESIRAILDGRKAMTRRVMRPQPTADLSWVTEWGWSFFTPDKHISGRIRNPAIEPREIFLPCPYALEQRLWVRETWRKGLTDDGLAVEYRADNTRIYLDDYPDNSTDWYWLADMPWKSPLFMPKYAARLWLEITSVKVERVQDISDADAIAEGVDRTNTSIPTYAIQRYRKPWDSINGHRPGCAWTDNPWVWALGLKCVSSTMTR